MTPHDFLKLRASLVPLTRPIGGEESGRSALADAGRKKCAVLGRALTEKANFTRLRVDDDRRRYGHRRDREREA